ncbi:MAG: toxic anion resistance protein [Lachnospiraceae bacterium]|nr:toxic anion resistance protein [Lachnospiraceae bacterium]
MSMNIDEMLKEAPTLTLEMPGTKEMPAAVTQGTVSQSAAPQEASEDAPQIVLTEEEQKMVDSFAKQIDITNTLQVLQYGAASQKKIADFSESALNSVRTKDMGEVGQMLTDIVVQLKDFESDDDAKGLFAAFKKNSKKQITTMKAKYDKAETNVNKISQALESHQITLLKDVAMLDKMYELNLNYYKELTMYILAGKQKLKEEHEVVLPALVAKADQSGLPEDTQAARDHADLINRFEKKLHDLELTRMVALQMAPQIRLIQNNDTAMSEKIQSTLVNTIPLWKSQMVIAIGLNHSTEAARAQHAVTDMTNELLKKNAETLRIATVETAKESERGIVDIETLKQTNQTLISTFDDVLKIQQEGREKRQLAEKELRQIEKEMHDKLLEMAREQ